MSNLNNENNTEIVRRNGKVFVRTKSGSEFNMTSRFQTRQPSPVKPRQPSPPRKRPRPHIIGPGTYFQNSNARKKQAALNVLNSFKYILNKNEFNHLRNYTNKLLNTVKEKIPGMRNPYKNYKVNRNGKLHAYAIIYNSPSNNKTRTIELLVSKGGAGKNIINQIKSNARTAHKNKLRIHAVKSAVNFYKSIGFKNRGNLNNLHKLMNYNI